MKIAKLEAAKPPQPPAFPRRRLSKENYDLLCYFSFWKAVELVMGSNKKLKRKVTK